MKHQHSRRYSLPFNWPDKPVHIVLVNPEIAPNTGNIARLCAATGSVLHLIEPLGFHITDAKLKRAGLDYWDSIDVRIYPSFDAFLNQVKPNCLHLFTTKAEKSYFDSTFHPEDALVFGCETKGLSDALLERFPDTLTGIPIQIKHVRSLNLSSAAAVVLYEALRQIGSPKDKT